MKTKCWSRLANMQTQTLILIKCSWLGRVKRKQQQAGIRKLYSVFAVFWCFLRNLLLSLPCGLIPARSLCKFCFPRRETSLSLTVPLTRVPMFPLSHWWKSLILANGSFPPGAFCTRQEQIHMKADAAAWNFYWSRRAQTFKDALKQAAVILNQNCCSWFTLSVWG